MRCATVGQWTSRNSRDELAHNEVRIIFSTYFISNLSYYISNIYFGYFELILGLYLVVYIYIQFIRGIFSTYFISNLSYYISNTVSEERLIFYTIKVQDTATILPVSDAFYLHIYKITLPRTFSAQLLALFRYI